MRISDWSSDVCSSDLSTTPWPWKVRRHPPAERAGRSGDAPPFTPVPTGNRKIRPEAPTPSLQEGLLPSLRTARKGRKRRRFLSSCTVARLGRGNEPDPPARAYEPDAPASSVQRLKTGKATCREKGW